MAQPTTGDWTKEAQTEAERKLLDDSVIETPAAEEGDVEVDTDKKVQFDMAHVSGDDEIVKKLDVWQEWADHVPFNPVTVEEINEFKGKLVKALHDDGYVFARVDIPTRVWANGIFLVKADCAKLGEVQVTGNENYSKEQITQELQKEEGTRFNYYDLHKDLYDLNTQQDLEINTDLKPRTEGGRRVVDANINVEDQFPLHFGVEVNNQGSVETNENRLMFTLQHSNLTKNFDPLSLRYITDIEDPSSLEAVAGNYSLPLPGGTERRLDLYGGWSDSELEDVAPALDVYGSGEYMGLKLSQQVYETPKYRWRGGLGWKYRNSEHTTDIRGRTFEDAKIELSLFSLSLDLSSKQFDEWGGRNFFNNTITAHWGGTFGSSDAETFEENRKNADDSFLIEEFSLSRLQRLPVESPWWVGESSVYGKLAAQYSTDSLVSEVQKGVGGANSVRGYQEREAYGDSAVTGTLEYRFPKITNFIKALRVSEESLEENPDTWKRHGVQFLTFLDYGWTKWNDAEAGVDETETLLGTGVGVRFDMSQYFQGTVDVGYPLEETEESDNARVHFSLKMQY